MKTRIYLYNNGGQYLVVAEKTMVVKLSSALWIELPIKYKEKTDGRLG